MTTHPPIEQFSFDFDAAERERPYTEHLERLARLSRESGEFSEERLCIAWITQTDGRHWQDWWRSLPSYERDHKLNIYRLERSHADYHGTPMRPYVAVDAPPCAEEIAFEQALVTRWGLEIRQAAIERRPIPFREAPEMTECERLTFRRRLQAACLSVNVTLIAPAPEPDTP